ncbi:MULTISPECIES: hypothetical protein [Caballeronia]|uniref:hypothetical protein n=1 Tax=Caballeronia TaxID=1827195 RepID=UPI000B3E6D17|nr:MULTISPECIES: hypothetical protein [Caballeronia]MDR5755247.1 hypothetical protein [Caballeronia sp. LZ024]MDR5845051.1 hypothetical protein [Caballeronia sp. LZ031]MDR5845119.1 hypothetical protein [Caballeronia sp. LZ031]
MNALVIKDLPVAVEMDRTAMAAVSGGRLPQQIVNIIQAVSDFANDAPVQHSFTGSGASTGY